jgi:hypothetical protein
MAHESSNLDLESDGGIARLQAERAIVETLHLYCVHMDAGDGPAWADLFTLQGVYETRFPQGLESRNAYTTGRDALVAYIARRPRGLTRHLVLNWVPRFDGGDSAHVDSTWMIVGPGLPLASIPAYGKYDDQMIRCGDGKWRFTHRMAVIEYSGASGS